MSLRTPLARAKGLGSAKEGVHHWWAQRVTAIALVPLALALTGSIVASLNEPDDPYADYYGRLHVPSISQDSGR